MGVYQLSAMRDLAHQCEGVPRIVREANVVAALSNVFYSVELVRVFSGPSSAVFLIPRIALPWLTWRPGCLRTHVHRIDALLTLVWDCKQVAAG